MDVIGDSMDSNWQKKQQQQNQKKILIQFIVSIIF